MAKSNIIYEEIGKICFKCKKTSEPLDYKKRIFIKDRGKKPVTVELEFCGIEPFAAPMPPKHHTITGESVTDLFAKLVRWAGRYGYSVW